MEFEWNSDKAIRNIQKHNVSFTEAATIFNDPLSLTYPDPDHSHYENRYITIGLAQSGKIIILAHTDRNNKIRIISARLATRQERRFYEEGK